MITRPHIHLIATTSFDDNLMRLLTGWSTDVTGGQALVEAAGRSCYQSWDKPNPNTATNAGYLTHIIDVGHLSVLEHATATFYLTGVSRALTHELVRHRHLSYSQMSQRFVNEDTADAVVPPLYLGNVAATVELLTLMERVRETYQKLLTLTPGVPRKQAREAARAVLPNMTETRIVVTGNYRAWREFVVRRTDPSADAEIQGVAGEILRILNEVAPNVFGDLKDKRDV